MKPNPEMFKSLMLELEGAADWAHRIGHETPKKLAHAKLMVDDGYLEHEGGWAFRITSKGHALCDAIRAEK